ncbi:Uncharacterised protein [Mycobacteroides abscessus subsp. abscessus]|nr:Uncharacterised protein [Mycobacteroides abscessus subsp. abscessus]
MPHQRHDQFDRHRFGSGEVVILPLIDGEFQRGRPDPRGVHGHRHGVVLGAAVQGDGLGRAGPGDPGQRQHRGDDDRETGPHAAGHEMSSRTGMVSTR